MAPDSSWFGMAPSAGVPTVPSEAEERDVWYDGTLRRPGEVGISFWANALHYGTAVFEGVRCYPTGRGPALFRLRDHLERFLFSARIYGMTVPFTVDELVEGAVEVVRSNGLSHAYLRPLAFFGDGPIDLKPKRECPVHVLIAARELGPFFGEGALRNGIRVTISSWQKFHHSMIPTQAKGSGHYVNCVLAMHEALDRGYDDAILLNQDGTVACATGENVFVVRDGVVVTNDVASSIVPGITRDCLLALAPELEVEIAIRPITREDLLRADEVFLTGTAAEVTPIRELDGISFATGKHTFGALFQRAYMRVVAGKNPAFDHWLTPL